MVLHSVYIKDSDGQFKLFATNPKIDKKNSKEIITCLYNAINGIYPKNEDCERLHPNGCDDCSYYLPDPPEPEDKNGQDELPC